MVDYIVGGIFVWCAVAVALAVPVGKLLARNSEQYPEPDAQDPDRSPCPRKFADGNGYDPDLDGVA